MRTAGLLLIILAVVAGGSLPAAAERQGRTHVVQPGESLHRIAVRYGISVEDIARANGIADPARLRAGRILLIPAGMRGAAVSKVVAARADRYLVQRGDTLSAIARRHGVTVAILRQVNGLRSDRIRPGQALRIPGTGRGPGPTVSTLPPSPELGQEVLAPRPLRVRRGPKTYHTTLALVAQGTPLRVRSQGNGWYEVRLPGGEVGWVDADDLSVVMRPPPAAVAAPAATSGSDIVREALGYVGTPYIWGGESTTGVDCSGFVYVVFSNRLPNLARLRSYDYFDLGTPVERANLLPGDLVFFTTYAPGPSHVGIYAGDGRFIQASSGARRVVVTPLDDRYYAARYLGARRLLAR